MLTAWRWFFWAKCWAVFSICKRKILKILPFPQQTNTPPSLAHTLTPASTPCSTISNMPRESLRKVMKQFFHTGISHHSDGGTASRNVNELVTSELSVMDSLPQEITLHIFSFLDMKSLGRMARVSKFFHEFSEYQELWYILISTSNNFIGYLLPFIRRGLLERNHGKVGLIVFQSGTKKERRSFLRKRSSGFLFSEDSTTNIIINTSPNGNTNNSNNNSNNEVLSSTPSFSPFLFSARQPQLDEETYTAYIKNTVKHGHISSNNCILTQLQ